MSTPEDIPAVRRSALPKAIVTVALAVLAMIAVTLVIARYGVLLPQTRLLIEASADGLKVGRFGRLKIEGLSGDIWNDDPRSPVHGVISERLKSVFPHAVGELGRKGTHRPRLRSVVHQQIP